MVLVLSMLLLGILVAFLIPSARAVVRGSAMVEAEQQAVVVSNHLQVDLNRTVPAAMTLTPRVLGMVPYRDVDSDGSLIWEAGLVAYCWEGKGQPLRRVFWDGLS